MTTLVIVVIALSLVFDFLNGVHDSSKMHVVFPFVVPAGRQIDGRRVRPVVPFAGGEPIRVTEIALRAQLRAARLGHLAGAPSHS